jgi:hypothetical protein
MSKLEIAVPTFMKMKERGMRKFYQRSGMSARDFSRSLGYSEQELAIRTSGINPTTESLNTAIFTTYGGQSLLH